MTAEPAAQEEAAPAAEAAPAEEATAESGEALHSCSAFYDRVDRRRDAGTGRGSADGYGY